MRGGIGFPIRAATAIPVVVVLLLAALTCALPEKVDASANLAAYMSAPSTAWEPMGYNETGTAPWAVVKSLGWDTVKIMGNVGIGDGSVQTLKKASTPDVKFADTGSSMMAADISMSPLDYSRMSGYVPVESAGSGAGAAQAQNNSSASNKTLQAMQAIPAMDALHFDNNLSEPSNTTNTTSTTEAATIIPAKIGGSADLTNPYYSIWMGRPVDDLMYEDPLAVPITAYARLTGFNLGGGCANIAIRCLGYGY